MPVPARWNDGRGVELLDQRRSRNGRADIKAVAFIEHRVSYRSIERHVPCTLDRVGDGARRWWCGGLPRVVFWDPHPPAQGGSHPLPPPPPCGPGLASGGGPRPTCP